MYSYIVSLHFSSLPQLFKTHISRVMLAELVVPWVAPHNLLFALQAPDFYVQMKWEFTSWGEWPWA